MVGENVISVNQTFVYNNHRTGLKLHGVLIMSSFFVFINNHKIFKISRSSTVMAAVIAATVLVRSMKTRSGSVVAITRLDARV